MDPYKDCDINVCEDEVRMVDEHNVDVTMIQWNTVNVDIFAMNISEYFAFLKYPRK